ncbi:extracellular matrix-binding protein ebh-like isoform X2 [Spodoptera frugiperda]|uniref:Extracellular matrix-binding protein ebh-like isoform X2 n=1 Tax=Spodoptera frugiperda TaxID=7108 RepID=A0A9R0E4E7_SPOFR|nr:extracellular matrix-binding protein ebh-like isoform X2 [Spodoptera frugiperda]
MEGDGEGMMAILQGLDPAGVTLTVMNRSRQNTDRRRSTRPRIQFNDNNFPRSSVEAGTDVMRKSDTGVQICDGRYASSYKTAHCMVSPTSPPEGVSEFPPQRREPCRNQGNFEVGGHGSGYASQRSSSRFRVHSGCQVRADRSSGALLHRSRSSRYTEAFVHSLRKYPCEVTGRTVSTDLIERLLRYTQSKNSSRGVRPSRSMRSLQEDGSDLRDGFKVSKHQQTYTRRPREAPSGPIGYKGRAKSFRLYSPVSESRHLRESLYREPKFSTSYDYLRAGTTRNRSEGSPSPSGSRSPSQPRPLRFERPAHSVRDMSLSDVSKYIRSTIRQIYRERPYVFQVCPRLMNRYYQHKKVCPVQNDGADEPTVMNDQESAGPRSISSRFLPTKSSCSEPKIGQSVGFQCNGTYCSCSRSIQCSCYPDAATNTSLTNLQPKKPKHFCCPKLNTSGAKCACPEETYKVPMICSCANDDEMYYNHRIDEEISDWLKHVPVQSIESADVKRKRDSMVRQLRKTLKQLRDDENSDDNVTKEVKTFIADFPIWSPGKDKKDEMQFKDKLAETLIGRITSVPRKPDKIKDFVRKWARENLEFEDGIDDADKEADIDNIVNHLKHLAADRPDNDAQYKEMLIKEITEMIKPLPLKIQDNRDGMLNKWATKLAAYLVTIPKNIDLSEDRTDFTFDLEDGLEGLLKELGIIREALEQLRDNPNILTTLAKRLNKLQAQGIDDEVVRDKMKNELRKFMDDLGVTQELIDELVDELMNQVDDTVRTSQLAINNIDELHEIVVDWLNKLPGIDQVDKAKFDKVSRDLVNGIKEAKEEGSENMESEIFGRIDEADLPIEAETIRKHIPDLIKKIDMWPSNKIYNHETKEALIEEIYQIIDSSKIAEEKKQSIKNRVQKIIDSHVMNASSLDTRQVHEYLKDALSDDVERAMSEEGIASDSQPDLLNKLTSAVSRNYFKSFIGLDRHLASDLKESAAKFIRGALDDVPMNGRRKKELIDEVKTTLDRDINKPLPDDIEDTITEEICGIVEASPVRDDDNIARYLKCLLSSISAKVFDMFTCKNNCVCHIQNRVENDVCELIDRCPMDCNKKRDLKRNVQDILSENEFREISDDAKQAVKGDIISVVSDLSIPEDKKNYLRSSVSETISQDFGDAIFGLRHDIGKVKHKIFNHLTNAIEKAPMSLDSKEYFHTKLKRMLNEKLDTTLTNEEKNTILDDVSDIVEDVLPEDKKAKLRNKLTNKLESEDSGNVFTDEIKTSLDQSIKDIIDNASIPQDTKNDLKKQLTASLDNNRGESLSEVRNEIKGKMFDIIDESPLVEDKQRALKKELVNLLTNKMGGTSIEHIGMDDYKRKITNDISELFAKLPISEDEKGDIKYQISKKVSDAIYRPLTDEVKTKIKKDINEIVKETGVPEKELAQFKPKLDAVLKIYLDVTPDTDKDLDVIKEEVKQHFSQAIEELPITNDKKRSLKIKLKDILVNNIDRKMTDDIQEDINKEIGSIIDNSSIPEKVPESKVLDMKDEVADIVTGLHLDEYMREYVVKDWIKELLTKNLEDVVNTFPTDTKNKVKLKKDIEKALVHSLYLPMTDTIKTNIRRDIINAVDKMGIDEEENGEVKRRLSSAISKGMDKKMSVGKDLDQIKSALQQIIKEGIENAPIPEYTQDLLAQETEDILNENLIQPITDEMKSNIHDQIELIIEDAKFDNEKYEKKLISTIEKNLRDIRSRIKGDLEAKKAKEIMLEKVRQKIDESTIDKQKKLELKSNLDKTISDYLGMPFEGKVRDDFQADIDKIVTEITSPGAGDKRPRRISISVDETAEGEIQDQELTKYIRNLENETQENILTELKKAIDGAPIYADKKREAKKNLLNIGKEYFSKPLAEESLRDLKDDLIDILDELQLPKDTRAKMLQQLSNLVDDLSKSKSVDSQETVKVNVLHAIKNTVNYATIPKDKKLELKNQLVDMAVRVFNTTPLEDILDALQDGASDILDDYPLIRDKKTKLRRDLEESIEEHLGLSEYYYPNVQTRFSRGIIPNFYVQREERTSLLTEEINRNKLRKSILQGIDEVISKSRLPLRKKDNLKEKISKTIDKAVRTSVPKDLEVDLKDSICDVVDEVLMFDSDKYKVRDDLTNIIDQRMDDVRRFTNDDNDTDGKRLQSFFRNLEKALNDALMPISKKNTLKNKLKILSDTGFKPPFSKAAQNIIIEGVDEILEELLSKDARKKNRKELRDIIGTSKNKQIVQEQITLKKTKVFPIKNTGATPPDDNIKDNEPKTIHDFFKVIENEISESHVFRKKKAELKINLHKMANDFFDNSWSEDVKDDLKRGISNILDDLLISRARKHKLKSHLETLIDEPPVTTSLEPWKEVKDLQKYPLEIFFHKLEEIIDENPVPVRKNKLLKKKLKDLSTPGFKQPFTRKQRNAVYDILDALPLSNQEKNRFIKELASIFGVVWTKGKESDRSKSLSTYKEDRFEITDEEKFEDFLHKFEEIIDENPLPEYKKKVLKRKLKELCTPASRKPFNKLWRNGVHNILDVLTLSEDEKNDVLRELGNILCVDLSTENEIEKSTALQIRTAKPDYKESSKLFLLDERVITKARESIVKNIERKIKETFMSGSKKAILMGRLQKLASNELQKPLSESAQETVREEVGDIINKLPIDEAEKDDLMQMVEENIEILKDLNRDDDNSHKQIQENISTALDNIVNKTLIIEDKKKYLKKKLRKLVEKTFEEALPDNVHGALIDGVNDIANEAGLAKAKRDKLKVVLMEAIDDNIGDLRDDEIDTTEDSRDSNTRSGPMRQINDTKTRTIDISTDLAPFDESDAFGTKTKRDRRYAVSPPGGLRQTERRFENRSKDSMPLQMKLLEAEDKVLRGETIGMETNPMFYRRNIFDKYAPPTEEAQKFKRKSALKSRDEKTNKMPILHMELDSETLDDVATDNLLSVAEDSKDDDTADLIEDIPLDKAKKHESADAENERSLKLPGKRLTIEQAQIQSILNTLETPIDDSQITTRQKDNLKEKLKIMFTKNYRIPLTDDLKDALKAEINVVLNEMPLTNYKKNKLEYELFHSLDSYLNRLQRNMKYLGHWISNQRESNEFKITDNNPKSIEDLFKIIENQIDESPILRRKKVVLKNNLQKIAEGYLNKSSSKRNKEDLHSGISNILNNLPSSEAEKDILKNYMKKSFDNRTETFSCQGSWREEKGVEKHPLEIFFHKLERIIDDKQVPLAKTKEVKKKLNDISSQGFKQPLTGQQRNAIYDILHILQIPEEEKNRLFKEFADILNVDWNMGKESGKINSTSYTVKQSLRNPRSPSLYDQGIITKARDRIVAEVERKIEETPMAISKKMKLMERLETIASDNLQGPLTEGMRDYVIRNIRDIIQQLPIHAADKYELTHKVDLNIKIICDKSQELRDRSMENPEERRTSQTTKGFDENKARYKKYDAETIAINEIDAFNARFKRVSRDSTPADDNYRTFGENYDYYKTNPRSSTSTKTNDMFNPRESIVQMIEHKRSRGKCSRDSAVQNDDGDDHQTQDGKFNTTTTSTDEPDKSHNTSRRSSTRDPETRKHARENIVHEFEHKIKEASISRKKRTELLEKLEKVSDSMKTPFSESHKNHVINNLNEIAEQLLIEEADRNELTRIINENIECLVDPSIRKKELKLLEKTREDNIHGFDEVTDKALISSKVKTQLKKILKELIHSTFHEPTDTSPISPEELKYGIYEVLNTLITSKNKKNILRDELFKVVDENIEKYLIELRKLQTGRGTSAGEIKESIKKSVEQSAIGDDIKRKIQREISEMLNSELWDQEDFLGNEDDDRSITGLMVTFDLDPKYESDLRAAEDELARVIREGGDVEAAKERLIKKIMEDTGLSREQAAKLVNQLEANASKGDKDDVQNIIDAFNLDPKYEKELKGIEDELTRVMLEGGDVEAAKERLIKKIMDETGLSREQATVLVNKLQAKANKENKNFKALTDAYNLDPEYAAELKKAEDELAKVLLEGGDVEAAKERLIKKIMDETGLPRDQAAELVNKLLEKANKGGKGGKSEALTKAFNLDPKYEKELKGIEDELAKVILEGGDVEAAKERLIKKIMDETGLPRDQAAALVDKLHAKANEDNKERLKGLVQAFNLDPKQLKDVEDELAKVIREGGDVDAAKERMIKKIMDETGLPREQAAELVNRLYAKANEDNKKGPIDLIQAFNLDPKYEKELKSVEDELAKVILEGGDVEAAKERMIKKIMDETGLSREQAAALVDKLHAKVNTENQGKSETLTKMFNLDPKYEKELKSVEDELTRVILEGGDVEAAKERLIKKLMDETGLTREQAAEIVNKLHAKVDTDTKDNLSDLTKTFNLDPKYEKELKSMEDELAKVILEGGDIAAAKERLIKKIMDETGLSRDQAAALVDKLHANADKENKYINSLTDTYNLDPEYGKELKAIEDELAKVIREGGDVDAAKERLIKKIMDETGLSREQAAELVDRLHAKANEDNKKRLKALVQASDLDPKYKSSIEDELAKAILEGGDVEAAKEKLIKKIMDETGLSREEAAALVNGLHAKIKADTKEMEDGAGLPSTKTLKAFQDSLIREMDSFLGPFDMPKEVKEKLKKTLLNELDKLLKNKTDPDIIMQHLIATIKRLTNLTDEEAVELARRLMNKTKEKGFLPKVCCPKRLSFASDAVCVQRKAFRDAILREIGDGFFGCHLSEEKKKYLEDLLIEDYAKEYGITLTECCITGDVGNENDITTIVNDWISTIPVTMRSDQDYNRFVQQKNELIPKIMQSLPASDYGSIREDAKTFLLKIPLHPDYKESEEQQDNKVEDLIDRFLCLPPKAKGHRYGMSFSGLTDYIDSWIDNLHISDDTRDEEGIKDMKKDMTYSLVHKLGEMNIDPEIFNDDSLYEEVLRDELQNMLGDVTITDANIKALKDDLIDKVKSAQQRAHDEIIGQNYKHKLRNAMANILPAACAMSKEENAAMELLKDQLADAYIDLNYAGDDENHRALLKRKITNEIHMFCNDYLSSHPASPLSNKQLNHELFNALTSVPMPSGDSIRYEVEQARIREVINEWIKELPLEYQSPYELLARNRLIYVLSKKLFDIETTVEDSPDEPMRKEIMKFLHKMPLKSGNEDNNFADNLIEKLNATKESRRFEDSIDETDASGNICDVSCPTQGKGGASSKYRKTAMTQERPCAKRSTFPPCTLSAEDKAHLDKIRRRSCVTPNCVKQILKNDKCTAAVGPQPMDAESQTELRTQGFEKDKQSICTGTNENMTRPCPGMSSSPHRSPCGFRRHTVSGSRLDREDQEEVLPQVVVKKYHWDSADKSNFQDSESQKARPPCSASFSPPRPGTCHPQDSPYQRPAPCQRPSTPPYHRKQESVPCQAGTPPYKKSSQSPYHRDCYKHDYEEQSTSPHRVPCNYDHSIAQGPETQPKKPVGRFYHWSPQRSFDRERISQSSQRSTPHSRSPAQSPCMSRAQSPYGMNHESTPLSCSNRVKRNGLQEQIPCINSRPSRKERVTELGSLDDIQHPRAKKNNSSFDWPCGQNPEDDSFWGTPCMRRVILDEGQDEPDEMMEREEREEREERVTCKCKERVHPKAMRSSCMQSCRDKDGRSGNNMQHRCSKCCGMHCPFPSFLYFRE